MAIAYDNKGLGVEGTGVTSLTEGTSWAIAGSNRFLIAMVGHGGGVSQPNPSSVKWGGSGGTNLTIVGANTQFTTNSGGYGKVSQYYLIAPTAQTSTLYCAWASAPDESYLCGISYTGVHQTTPLGTQATNTGNLSSTATVNASSATGELVVDSVFVFGLNLTPDASQTIRHENDDIQGYWSGGMTEEAGASTVTMSWALGTNEDWGIQAVPLKPYAAPTAALTGTATSSITESDIVTGGKTVILTLTDDSYVVATGTPTFSTATTAGTTSGDGRTGDGALTINWPTGYTATAGHFALAVVYSDQGSGSTPTDWSAVTGQPFGGGTEKLNVFYKVLAGGESAPSTTISGSGTNVSHCAGMMIYTGVGSIGAIGTASNGTGTPMTAGAITTTADGSIVIALSGRGDNEVSGSQTFGGSATGVNERMDAGTASGNDSQVSAADKTITTSGTSSGNASSTTSVTDPWVSVIIELKPSTPFADQRAAIRNGLDSAQSEAAGWDAKVKGNIPVANVVRTSNTVCTITLQAQSDYNITATETITATIPAAALTGGAQIVASPTFTVSAAGGSYTVTSTAGSATAAGVAATLKRDKLITSTAGAITLAGVSATLTRNYVVTSTAGAITVTGAAATLLKTRLVTGTAGAATAAGVGATLTRNYVIAATAGAAAAEGVAGTLTRSYTTTSTAGAITLAGAEATLLKSRVIVSTAGSAAAAGVEATLTYGVSYKIDGTAGSATAAGVAATIKRTYLVTATAGEITVAGASATLGRDYVVSSTAGAATAEGVSAALTRSYATVSTAGAITLTGAEATLTRSYVVTSTAGAVTGTGIEATLTYTPAVSGYVITAYPGLIDLSGASATLTYTGTPAPVQFVGAVGRGRSRVLVRIENGQVYEVKDEPEARKVVKTIKRRVQRQIHRAERENLPPVEIPTITVEGNAPFVASLQREVEAIRVDWAAVQRRMFDEWDEDDIEALLL